MAVRPTNITKSGHYMTGWLLTLVCLIIQQATMAQESKNIERTIPINADGRVTIQTFKGTVDVSVWDRNEVEIKALIEPDGFSNDEEDAVEDTEVRINESTNSVYIESDYSRVRTSSWGWNSNVNRPLVHYTIKMPRNTRLEIDDHKSEINLSGLDTRVNIDTHKGPIQISNMAGDLRIDTHKSRVQIRGFTGTLDVETHEGDVEVEFASLSDRSRFESHKGDIEITLPKDSGFDLDADMGNKGDLRADFDIRQLEQRSGRRKRDLEYRGAVNGGGPLLRLTTYKGRYRLRAR